MQKSRKFLIVCLPGFLGQQSDFTRFNEVILKYPITKRHDFKYWTPSIFAKGAEFPPQLGFQTWSQRVFAKVCEIREDREVIVIGYSLGGRLAMHLMALNHHAKFWKALCLIASDTGLTDVAQRVGRQKFDQYWAQQFQAEDWDTVIHNWNQLPIFEHDEVVERRLEDICRDNLAAAFTQLSPRRHCFELDDLINSCETRIGIIGGLDERYRKKYKKLHEAGVINSLKEVPQIGHRVLHSIDKLPDFGRLLEELLG